MQMSGVKPEKTQRKDEKLSLNLSPENLEEGRLWPQESPNSATSSEGSVLAMVSEGSGSTQTSNVCTARNNLTHNRGAKRRQQV